MSARYSDFRKLYGSGAAADYNIHVSTRDNYIYFVNPKVACSSIKATLNTREAAGQGHPFALTSMDDVHSRSLNPLQTPGEVGAAVFNRMLADQHVTRFSFVRDPVRRVCSAYLSKIGSGTYWSKEAKKLHDHLGLGTEAKLSLAEFIQACAEDETARDLDPHWRLQRKQICWDFVDYTFIGRHEHFADDFATLTAHVFGDPVEVFDSRTTFGHHSPSPQLSGELSDDLRHLIERVYAADYDMLAEIAQRELWAMPPKPARRSRLRQFWRKR